MARNETRSTAMMVRHLETQIFLVDARLAHPKMQSCIIDWWCSFSDGSIPSTSSSDFGSAFCRSISAFPPSIFSALAWYFFMILFDFIPPSRTEIASWFFRSSCLSSWFSDSPASTSLDSDSSIPSLFSSKSLFFPLPFELLFFALGSFRSFSSGERSSSRSPTELQEMFLDLALPLILGSRFLLISLEPLESLSSTDMTGMVFSVQRPLVLAFLSAFQVLIQLWENFFSPPEELAFSRLSSLEKYSLIFSSSSWLSLCRCLFYIYFCLRRYSTCLSKIDFISFLFLSSSAFSEEYSSFFSVPLTSAWFSCPKPRP